MKISVVGMATIPLGKHNLKDPRLDQAHELVEAKKKTCIQVDLVGEDSLREADAIVVHPDRRPDLVLEDIELVETRLGRNPAPTEHRALTRLLAALEQECTVRRADLTPEERQAIAAHRFVTDKPLITPVNGELHDPDALMLRAYADAGYISFLTVGGKENRAWRVRKGATAWDAAAAIHTEIQRGFIRAEVIPFEALVTAGGETAAKRAGKLRLETRAYVVQDYDVVSFRFSRTTG